VIKYLPIFCVVILLVLLGGARSSSVNAYDCGISVSSQNVLQNSSTLLTLRLTNLSSDTFYRWTKFVSESPNALYFGALEASGWSTAEETSQATFYSDIAIEPGLPQNFQVEVLTASEETSVTITAYASQNIDGSSPILCGATNINIVSVFQTNPVLSNISLTTGATSATVTWNTDIASTSRVDFGTTTGYGSNSTGSDAVTNHSLSMSGLSASTTYHYKLTNVSESGGTTSTADYSFTTSAASVNTTTTTTVTTVVASTPIVITLKDTAAPTIKLTTDFTKAFSEAPTITGTAADGGTVNAGIISVEYSLDGGKNWLPVDNIVGLGKRSATFEFTPIGLTDGNYQVRVRAKDITGNTGTSKTYTLVFDRLPPMVGGTLFSLGPLIFHPDENGSIYSIAGLPIKVILSAVGGPLNIDLLSSSQQFSLIKNTESGLWSGQINLNQAGNFLLLAKSIDGAANETEKNLGTINVLSPGKVVDEKGQPLSKTKISVYTYEKTTNDYVLWDAEPYLQTNPQETDNEGYYRLLLPSGKYYLELVSPGKRKLRTEIFSLDSVTPLIQNFTLEKGYFWSSWWAKTTPYSQVITTTSSPINSLVGKPLPDFDLGVPGTALSNTSILGKPTIITFIGIWEPQTSDQLLALDQFKAENEGVGVFAVAVQESLSKTDIFKKTGGYQTPVLADPDGVLVTPLSLQSLPTHIILDRKGIIKEVVVGFLNKENLLFKILN
jgi:hypothetical protein